MVDYWAGAGADVRERAAKVRLLVLDVDGVLTDGGLYYNPEGVVSKRFNVQDGLGIKVAQQHGLEVAVITGLNQPVVEHRVRELGIGEYHPGHHEKASVLRGICARLGLELSEAAFLGDDWVDATALMACGLPMAVPNARPEIAALAVWTTPHPGGQGAVRDAVDLILRARGLFDKAWHEWIGV
jgi:3-deoxy-D-manno-octulosonate 8-phosphate phosphatase (KDO 8-P phosphatase)